SDPSSRRPSVIPAQTTRGRDGPGNTPRPAQVSVIGRVAAATAASESRIAATRSSGTSPRNLRVRCIAPAPTHRTSARGATTRRGPARGPGPAVPGGAQGATHVGREIDGDEPAHARASPPRSGMIRFRLRTSVPAALSPQAPAHRLAYLALQLAAQ